MTALGVNARDESSADKNRSLESATWNAFLDRPSAEVLLDAIEFLGGTPNPHSLCRYLTLSVAAGTRPVAALICVLEVSGSLRIAGAFGLDDEGLAASTSQSMADDSPLVEAIRSGTPKFHSTADGVRESFPEFARGKAALTPTAIWPIASRGDCIGAIQLFFGHESIDSPLTADFDAVVALVALYVRLQLASGVAHTRWSMVDRRQPAGDSARPDDRRRPSGFADLTERQSVVLDQIVAGRTNAQIAHAVGFSESTVRQETMAIYRTLGVEGRAQAAAATRAHRSEAAAASLVAEPVT